MKELKGVELIDNILNNFLIEFDAIAELGTDFCYWNADSTINYSLVISDNHNNYFMDNFNRLAPDITCDVFLISFLHELGHHETLHIFDDMDAAYCLDVKKDLSIKLKDVEGLDKEAEREIYQTYFDLPDEYEATMWAIEYIRENTEKIAEFWNKLQAAIMNFYKLNEVEVEYGC